MFYGIMLLSLILLIITILLLHDLLLPEVKSESKDVNALTTSSYYTSKSLSSQALSSTKLRMKTIFWMHIQKTSSWIGNFLIVWACPDFCVEDLQRRNGSSGAVTSHDSHNPYDYLHHIELLFRHHNISRFDMIRRSNIMRCSVNFESYHAGFGFHRAYNIPKQMNHTIVTLFRKPSSRVISAYLFDIMFPLGSQPTKGLTFEQMKHHIKHSKNPILSYANTTGISSCQTKMILGYNCGEQIMIYPKSMIEAKRRLYDLYFFGLTEEAEASANLFLAMHSQEGGYPYRNNVFEMTNPPFIFTTTRTNKVHSENNHMTLYHNLTDSGWKDVYDEELYIEASKIFYGRCRSYDIPTSFPSIVELLAHLHI